MKSCSPFPESQRTHLEGAVAGAGLSGGGGGGGRLRPDGARTGVPAHVVHGHVAQLVATDRRLQTHLPTGATFIRSFEYPIASRKRWSYSKRRRRGQRQLGLVPRVAGRTGHGPQRPVGRRRRQDDAQRTDAVAEQVRPKDQTQRSVQRRRLHQRRRQTRHVARTPRETRILQTAKHQPPSIILAMLPPRSHFVLCQGRLG